jgi:hypothetical protein
MRTLLALLGFLAAFQCSADQPPFNTSLDKSVNEFGHAVAQLPEVKALGGAGWDVIEYSLLLARNGLKRLRNEDLHRRVEIDSKLLGLSSDGFCSTMFKNEMYSSLAFRYQLSQLLGKLSPEDLKDYFAISLRAVNAELKGLPARDSSYSSLEGAFDYMLGQLAKEDAARFKRIWGGDLFLANDSDVCWVGRVAYSLALKADDPHKKTLLLLLAQ